MSSEGGTDPRIGTVLNGRYRITEHLGEGGMGVVYRAERVKLDRSVAVKFLHSPYTGYKEFLTRFEREARAMSMLSHPCCVSVIDFGLDGAPYIVMDFVTGHTLRSILDEGRFPPQRAVAVIRQVLSGLAHAHGQGIIHRDIKPANIMLGEATGLGEVVRIFDFGLAKLQDPEAHGDPSVGHLVGTPSYMAPEQTRGDKLDARVDIYATGVVLFELLTGQKPFDAADTAVLLRQHREQPPPHVRQIVPEISSEMDAVVWKALQKSPHQRFASAEEFMAALDATPEAQGRPSGSDARKSLEEAAYARTEAFTSERIDSPLPQLAGPPRSVQDPSGGGDTLAWVVVLLTALGVAALLWISKDTMVEVFGETKTKLAARNQEPTPRGAPVPATPATEPPVAEAPIPEPPTPEPPIPEDPVVEAPAPEVAAPEAPVAVPDLPNVPSVHPPDASTIAVPPSDPSAMRFKVPDAGAVVDELSEASLAAADQALNDTSESEAVVAAPVAAPTAHTLADVERLIAKGRTSEAIDALRVLRRKDGKNPMLALLLGNLYFEKGWWSDGLVKYREAIRIRSRMADRATLQKNAIMALGADKTYARARALFVRDIRRRGIDRLRRAAKSDPSPIIRKRASAVVRYMSR